MVLDFGSPFNTSRIQSSVSTPTTGTAGLMFGSVAFSSSDLLDIGFAMTTRSESPCIRSYVHRGRIRPNATRGRLSNSARVSRVFMFISDDPKGLEQIAATHAEHVDAC